MCNLFQLLTVNATESYFKYVSNHCHFSTVSYKLKTQQVHLQSIVKYFHQNKNFTSNHLQVKKLYLHVFDIVDIVLSYERELIVCLILYDLSKGKGSSLQLICNAHTAFLLCRAVLRSVIIYEYHYRTLLLRLVSIVCHTMKLVVECNKKNTEDQKCHKKEITKCRKLCASMPFEIHLYF